MNNTVNPGWNTVTDPKSFWFGVRVWVFTSDVFKTPNDDHVPVMTSDDAPVRSFPKSWFK